MRIDILSAGVLAVAAIAWGSFVVCRIGRAHSDPSHLPPKPEIDLPQPTADEKTRTAVFAGGCFWCSEGVFEQLAGVSDVVSGYAGGTKETADYETVSTGTTRHAESVRVTYDPHKITYGQLLRVFFFNFDPTTLNSQGPDHGPQYRTAVFYENPDQQRVAEAYIKQLTDDKYYDKPIVTTVEPIGDGFFPAEKYHQDYVRKHPDQPYIVQEALPKIEKVREFFKDLVKPSATEPTTQK